MLNAARTPPASTTERPRGEAIVRARSDVEAFAGVHVGRPASDLIANLSTQIELIGSGDTAVPVTINTAERHNAWVCSPYTAYCSYAIEELHRFAHPAFTWPLTLMCRAAGAALKHAEIDRAVAVNNWLLSTNLYGNLDRPALNAWLDETRDRWPTHAVWFRSLNGVWTAEWLAALKHAGFLMIPSRQVYLYAGIAGEVGRFPNLKTDFRLLQTTPLERCDGSDFRAADWARAETLYTQLYLDKYSHLNPAYRAQFIEAWHRAGLLKVTGFRDDQGVLQAVLGTFERFGVLTAPIVGYNTGLPQRMGLYRLLMAVVLKDAADSGKRVNLSAGAAHFKRTRGGVGAIEYSAVLVAHLPRKRQRAVHVLRALTEQVGVPLMRRFKL